MVLLLSLGQTQPPNAPCTLIVGISANVSVRVGLSRVGLGWVRFIPDGPVVHCEALKVKK